VPKPGVPAEQKAHLVGQAGAASRGANVDWESLFHAVKDDVSRAASQQTGTTGSLFAGEATPTRRSSNAAKQASSAPRAVGGGALRPLGPGRALFDSPGKLERASSEHPGGSQHDGAALTSHARGDGCEAVAASVFRKRRHTVGDMRTLSLFSLLQTRPIWDSDDDEPDGRAPHPASDLAAPSGSKGSAGVGSPAAAGACKVGGGNLAVTAALGAAASVFTGVSSSGAGAGAQVAESEVKRRGIWGSAWRGLKQTAVNQTSKVKNQTSKVMEKRRAQKLAQQGFAVPGERDISDGESNGDASDSSGEEGKPVRNRSVNVVDAAKADAQRSPGTVNREIEGRVRTKWDEGISRAGSSLERSNHGGQSEASASDATSDWELGAAAAGPSSFDGLELSAALRRFPVTIENIQTGRRVFASPGRQWLRGYGATRADSPAWASDQRWWFVEQPGGAYLVVNAGSGRRLFARKFKPRESLAQKQSAVWERNVGAGPPGQTFPDNRWYLVPLPGVDQDEPAGESGASSTLGGAAFLLANAESGRALYARPLPPRPGQSVSVDLGAAPVSERDAKRAETKAARDAAKAVRAEAAAEKKRKKARTKSAATGAEESTADVCGEPLTAGFGAVAVERLEKDRSDFIVYAGWRLLPDLAFKGGPQTGALSSAMADSGDYGDDIESDGEVQWGNDDSDQEFGSKGRRSGDSSSSTGRISDDSRARASDDAALKVHAPSESPTALVEPTAAPTGRVKKGALSLNA